MTAKIKYFSGTVEVFDPRPIPNTSFTAIGGTRNKHNYYDSFKRLAGYGYVDGQAILPISRVICIKKNPSLHKCDARCINATGSNCECSCGGANHGAGNA